MHLPPKARAIIVGAAALAATKAVANPPPIIDLNPDLSKIGVVRAYSENLNARINFNLNNGECQGYYLLGGQRSFTQLFLDSVCIGQTLNTQIGSSVSLLGTSTEKNAIVGTVSGYDNENKTLVIATKDGNIVLKDGAELGQYPGWKVQISETVDSHTGALVEFVRQFDPPKVMEADRDTLDVPYGLSLFLVSAPPHRIMTMWSEPNADIQTDMGEVKINNAVWRGERWADPRDGGRPYPDTGKLQSGFGVYDGNAYFNVVQRLVWDPGGPNASVATLYYETLGASPYQKAPWQDAFIVTQDDNMWRSEFGFHASTNPKGVSFHRHIPGGASGDLQSHKIVTQDGRFVIQGGFDLYTKSQTGEPIVDSSIYAYFSMDAFTTEVNRAGDTLWIYSQSDTVPDAAFLRSQKIPTSVEEQAKLSKAQVFPNPAQDGFTVQREGTAQGTMTISNELGQTVLKQRLEAGQNDVRVPAANLPAGTYFILIKSVDGTVEESKFFKQ